MADEKITELDELTSVADEDLLPIVDDPAGTPVTKKTTRGNLVAGLATTGHDHDADYEASGALATHTGDTSDAHDASAISFSPAGSIAATDVQAALEEIDNEKQAADADLTAIAALSPSNDDIIQRKAGAWTVRTVSQYLADLAAANSNTLQPYDADLAAIAGLSPSNDDVLQRKAGAWTNRTMAQLLTDLGIVKHTRSSSAPGSPATGDLWTDSDDNVEYFYDGTRWLSAQRHDTGYGNGAGLAATTTLRQHMVKPEAQDKYILEASLHFFVVSGGSALDGSHNWTVAIQKAGSSGQAAFTTPISWTINSGASNAWRVATPISLNELLGSGYGSLIMTATKTGTPGNLIPVWSVNYRLVG